MEKQIYRKKSIDRVTSPEELNEYIKVSNPGVWMILSAVVVLLAGVCVWGIFGHLDTTIETAVMCKDGKITCYIKEEEASKFKDGMYLEINDEKYEVSAVEQTPIAVDDSIDSYVQHKSDIKEGDWVYVVTADCDLTNGTYDADLVVESISPLSFVTN